MSDYKKLVSEYQTIGLISKEKSNYIYDRYEKLTDANKEIADKHRDALIIEHTQNIQIKRAVKSIKLNVQFLAWVTIINLLGLFYLAYSIN